MIGAPEGLTSWDGWEYGSYYAGHGGELIWLIISIVMCIVALWVGSRHEKEAYKKAAKK